MTSLFPNDAQDRRKYPLTMKSAEAGDKESEISDEEQALNANMENNLRKSVQSLRIAQFDGTGSFDDFKNSVRANLGRAILLDRFESGNLHTMEKTLIYWLICGWEKN